LPAAGRPAVGADKASLDKLVKFVEEARRKLFEARANLENSALAKKTEVLLDDSRDALARLSGRAVSIKEFARTDCGCAGADRHR
jgi:hypothetical protein